VLAAGAAGVAIALPWLAEREQAAALRAARTDPGRALRALDRAAGLAPLDARPLLLAGFVELERGRLGPARAAFLRALDREEGWLAHAELGLIAAAEGRTAEARRRLATAARMSSEEELVAFARERLAEGRPVDPVAVNRQTLDEPLYRLRPAT
jgi:tetratricopeptide (TPR) repeat protein